MLIVKYFNHNLLNIKKRKAPNHSGEDLKPIEQYFSVLPIFLTKKANKNSIFIEMKSMGSILFKSKFSYTHIYFMGNDNHETKLKYFEKYKP
jgi:hypothetical protein